MCGICGIVDYSGSPIDEDVLWCMTKTLEHRGPDDSGVEILDFAGLGHRRLSIIDLSSAGHQPMQSENDDFTLVYNGEIYNFQTIRHQLENEGVKFKSRSDTEVVLRAYMHWGTGAFAMFKGMFTLAVWDKAAQRLHMARDRFGIKPLYYYPLKTGIIFGSEIKALLASQLIQRQMSLEGLHEYLYYGNALGSHTLFDGVLKLCPGHYISVDKNGIDIHPYWSACDIEPVSDTVEHATRTIDCHLEEAVKSHLISDVPVGVFLSGGIDSSAITALASRHYDGQVKTFSVGFDFDRGVNELPKARQVAERFRTDHHELHIKGSNIQEVIEKLVYCHDEPFGDAANIPLYLLCEKLKGSIKVILQGDGGDEIFAGYRRYNILSNKWFWRYFSHMALFTRFLVPRSPQYYRAMRFFNAMAVSDPAMRMALLLTSETLEYPPVRVLTEEICRELSEFDPFTRYRQLYDRTKYLDTVQQMLYVDTQILLPDTYLEKVDKSTMAHGIEIRVPFLDVDLSAYAMGLPSSYKVKRAQKKWILRRALRGIVSDAILDGPKTGFGVPYEYWLRKPLSEYMRSVLLDSVTLNWGIFDRKALEVCIEDHIRERRNNGFLLYKLLNLALWHKFYLA